MVLLIDEISKMDLLGSRNTEPTPCMKSRFFNKNIAWTRNFENAKFCVDLPFSSTSVYFFPALPGAARCALASHYGRDFVLERRQFIYFFLIKVCEVELLNLFIEM